MSDYLYGIIFTVFIVGMIMVIGGLGWWIASVFTGVGLVIVFGLYLAIISMAVGILFEEIGVLDD